MPRFLIIGVDEESGQWICDHIIAETSGEACLWAADHRGLTDVESRTPDELRDMAAKLEAASDDEIHSWMKNYETDEVAAACEGCEGTGIRPHTNNGKMIEPPAGFVIVERCDHCQKYASDLEAARAYGPFAHEQFGGGGGCQAICVGPTWAERVRDYLERDRKAHTAVGGSWWIDPGKMQAALEQAAV